MTRPARLLFALLLLTCIAGVTLGIERFPPPDFTDHALPTTQVVPPRSDAWEYVDLAVLAVCLTLATYLALVKRSRRGLFLLTIFALIWFGFWREGCICSIGAIQNVALGLCDPTYAIPFAAVGFFVLPLVFTLFFGRTFCAAVCPLGAVQELVALRPIKVPAWLEQTLGLLPYVYLGTAVALAANGTAFVICRYDPFVALFRRSGSLGMLVFGGSMLVVGLFVGRPYCRYLCPYGALLGLCSKVSKWHVRITPDECTNCRLCEDACPYGAIHKPTSKQPTDDRITGRRRLGILLAVLPVLIVVGFQFGTLLAEPLARMDPTFRLAQRVQLEETQEVQDTTDASDAFRNTGRPIADLYREANRLEQHFALVGGWLGAWVGLVIGVKLIHLSIRRRRTEHEPDPLNCVSCGRCFWYCPAEQVRLGLIQVAPTIGITGAPITGVENVSTTDIENVPTTGEEPQ